MANKISKQDSSSREHARWPFGKRNYMVLALALIVIIIGYITLGQGSITLAPLLLVIGYCVLIPTALLIKDSSRREPTAEASPPSKTE